MSLLRIARVPAVTVTPATSVQGAVDTMTEAEAGAVIVSRDGFPTGIFTARDLVRRVMASRFPLDVVSVSEVMTSSPKVATVDMLPREALGIMMGNHIRHLPIVDGDGRVKACCRHVICCARCSSTFLMSSTPSPPTSRRTASAASVRTRSERQNDP